MDVDAAYPAITLDMEDPEAITARTRQLLKYDGHESPGADPPHECVDRSSHAPARCRGRQRDVGLGIRAAERGADLLREQGGAPFLYALVA